MIENDWVVNTSVWVRSFTPIRNSLIIINTRLLLLFRMSPKKLLKNDSHDFRKYKTLDVIIIIIIDAITEYVEGMING